MIGRNYNPKTNTVSGAESNLPLEQKVRLKRAIRAADEEHRALRLKYYEMQDAGIDADKALADCKAKYWKIHKRRGYEFHEFIGEY